MRIWLLLLLVGCWTGLRAQTPGQAYANARAGYRLSYPSTWQVAEADDASAVTFYAGAPQRPAPVEATLTYTAAPGSQPNALVQGRLDTLAAALRRLPRAWIRSLQQRDAGSYQELYYEYTYAPAPAAPIRVLGRRLWRGGYELRLELRAPVGSALLGEGRRLLESLTLTGAGPAPVPGKAAAPAVAAPVPPAGCDDKMYGIAALRVHNGIWEDDCRTIHEFDLNDLSAEPKVHRQVLPFQSYALAKGFDNCLYAVTKAPTNAPEYVYRYDPATRQGSFTSWQLPAQGGESVWISGATDGQGRLYFATSDGNQLVRVDPASGQVLPVWTHDPVQEAPYYRAIGFKGAGTHANFCLDESGLLYEVYSTDGAILKVDLRTLKAEPDLTVLDGLPERGGYSDVLLQKDADGRRRLYLAGPKSVYEVDLAYRDARRVRRGVYTDLAGCNIFRRPPAAAVAASPAPVVAQPTTATWQGRVLDARTLRPLPQAQLRLRSAAALSTAAPRLSATGDFSVSVPPNYPSAVQVQLSGYLAVDSLYTLPPGPSVQDILLRPLTPGTTASLENVQFEQGQAVLLPSSYPALNQLLELLLANPGLTIELRGHTDNVGDPQKNVALSQQRVTVVKAYLVAHGIGAERISGVGLGGAEPRASNAQEATRKLNRRVEFRVTSVQ